MKRNSLVLYAIIMIMIINIAFVGAGCQKDDSNQAGLGEGETSNSNINSSEDKNLNMAIFWLDPNIEPTEGWNGWTLTRCGIGENLIQIDENLNVKPVVAESYAEVDEKTYVFNIRENVKFQNGKNVTADSCKQSIERALLLTDREDVKFNLDSIDAEGQMLTIKLVDEFDPDSGMKLSKNEYHWSGEIGIDTVDVKYVQDGTTRAMMLQSGEIDFAPQIETNDLRLFKDDDRYVVLKGANLRVFLLRLNMEKPYMQSKEFRQALAYGIDKQTYADNIVHGINAKGPFNSMLPFGSSGEDVHEYSPEKAKELLDDAGIVDTDGDGIRELDGENIILKYYSRTNHGAGANNIGIAMQSQYKDIGIGLEVFQVENYSDIAKKGEFDLLWERWTSAPSGDPQYFFDASYKTGSAGNFGNYSNSKFDEICDKLNDATEKQEREQLGIEGAKLLVEDVASLFMYYQEGNVVVSSEIDGVHRFISEIYYIDERLGFKNQ
ncbi:ABC transporter substrate-binding protein [Alkalibacter mobilis]|uniref:ABC transporter substrate-binding protein n=1 Tax=Alkalibacter mobilis TaxID=2787712 RepID=UPI00189DF281|nr:ABC transporter substrate-binding protein [Alkalibacter mobilis]MBF7096791.1 hypothetical protein [Alkalibacter mobilis]